jgi:hypothetical protein
LDVAALRHPIFDRMEIGQEERPRAAVSACLVRQIRLRKARSDDERTPKASFLGSY